MTERPEGEVPWPKTEDALVAYVREMAAWPNGAREAGEGYGRCVYAMSNAALATFRYIAGALGVTGFQAGAAEMQFLADSRGMKHGFILFDGDNLLYPQYDFPERLAKWIAETRPQLADEAKRLLADEAHANPAVVAHWKELAALPPTQSSEADA